MEENEVEDILSVLTPSSNTPDDKTTMESITAPSVPPRASEDEILKSTATIGRSGPLVLHSASPFPVAFGNLNATTSQTGSPPPVLSLFPELDRDDVVCIMTHELCGKDLYKLYTRPTTGDDNNVDKDSEYTTFKSLYLPLLRYFEMVSIYFAQDYSLPMVFFEFLAHFQDITSQYEWPAVRQYTLSFFNHRRREVIESNNYSGWAIRDSYLFERYLSGNEKGCAEEYPSMSSSTTISISDITPVISPPVTVDIDDEASHTIPLLIGFIWWVDLSV